MTDQNTFMETLKNVAQIIYTAPVPLEEKEILSYFEDMELSDAQKAMVLDYLKNPDNVQSSAQGEPDAGADTEREAEEPEEDAEAGERPDLFLMYTEELQGIPKYTPEQRQLFYEDLQRGNEQAIHSLTEAWLERILDIAKSYAEPKIPVEDLVQEGNLALFMKLSELLGTSVKGDIEQLLASEVEQAILHFASEMNGERELENAVLGKVSLIHEAKKLLTEEKGREPRLSELAAYTHIPEEELSDLLDMVKSK